MGKRKRESSDAGHDSFLEELKCPVCLDFMREKIFQCSQGHLVCGDCKKLLTTNICPTCRGDMGSNRCRVAEKARETLKFPCQWQEDGCSVSLVCRDLHYHEQTCAFRPVQCDICGESVSISSFERHLSVKHKLNPHELSDRLSCEIKLTNSRGDIDPDWIFVLKSEEETYLLKLYFKATSFFAILRSLKFDSDFDKRHICTITVDSGTRNISWTSPIRTVRVSCEDVQKTEDCFQVKASLVKHMAGVREDMTKFKLDVKLKLGINKKPITYPEAKLDNACTIS